MKARIRSVLMMQYKEEVKIENAGGKIVVPKIPVPTVGWLAYFTDPDRNIHGVYQEDRNAM